MLLKFTVKAVKGAEIKQIEALQKKLADAARLNAVVGRSFEKTLRNHFRKQNRRPNKRGWRKQGVWNKIAADTAFAGADETSATVTIRNPIIKTKIFGARIKPKGGKKFLAIPAIEARYGMMPSALDDELQFRKTRRGGILGRINSDGTMQVHYWLVRKADVPRDPQALPASSEVASDANIAISKYIRRK